MKNLTELGQQYRAAAKAGDTTALERFKQQARPPKQPPPAFNPSEPPSHGRLSPETYEALLKQFRQLEVENKRLRSELGRKGERLYQAEHELQRLQRLVSEKEEA